MYRKFGGVVNSIAYVMYPDFETARKVTEECAAKCFLFKDHIVQVEIAPYQRIAKPADEHIRSMGTIESDPDYIGFLENLEARKNQNLPSAEERLIQSTKQNQSSVRETPQSSLVQFMLMKQQNEEKRKMLTRKSQKKNKKGNNNNKSKEGEKKKASKKKKKKKKTKNANKTTGNKDKKSTQRKSQFRTKKILTKRNSGNSSNSTNPSSSSS